MEADLPIARRDVSFGIQIVHKRQIFDLIVCASCGCLVEGWSSAAWSDPHLCFLSESWLQSVDMACSDRHTKWFKEHNLTWKRLALWICKWAAHLGPRQGVGHIVKMHSPKSFRICFHASNSYWSWSRWIKIVPLSSFSLLVSQWWWCRTRRRAWWKREPMEAPLSAGTEEALKYEETEKWVG